jgi:hypothetical protein
MLKQDDYKTFVPQAEHEIKAHGHVSLLIHIAGLRGASPPALWEDLKFDASHYNDVARLALVGTEESDKQLWMGALARPFTSAEVKTFSEAELAAAREWVRATR